MIKLDYSINDINKRKEIVDNYVASNPKITNYELEILSDYLVLCLSNEEKKSKEIITPNRMVTINKRETSFQGLIETLESLEMGEDKIYGLIKNDKNIIFQPKYSITQNDIETMPELKELKNIINKQEKQLEGSSGEKAYLLKKGLIEMRKDQYIIKNSYQKVMKPNKLTHELAENDNSLLIYTSLTNRSDCLNLMNNYYELKSQHENKCSSDIWSVLQDFEEIKNAVLADYPIYQDIFELRARKYKNKEVAAIIKDKYNEEYSPESISNIWCRKIPRMIAKETEARYLDYYYLNVAKGKYKKCSRCGEIKLAHPKFFSINKDSKDGYYSICKECRRRKREKKKKGDKQ